MALTASLSLYLPGEGRVMFEDLQDDHSLLAGRTGLGGLSGSVALEDGPTLIMLEDPFEGLMDYFLRALPGDLAEGSESQYRFRSEALTLSVMVDGEKVGIAYDTLDRIDTTKGDLDAMLAQLRADRRMLDVWMGLIDEEDEDKDEDEDEDAAES